MAKYILQYVIYLQHHALTQYHFYYSQFKGTLKFCNTMHLRVNDRECALPKEDWCLNSQGIK